MLKGDQKKRQPMRIDYDPYIDDRRYNRLEWFVELMLQPLFREKPEVQRKIFSIDQYQFYIGPVVPF